MDNIFKLIESLPDNVKNLIISSLIKSSMAMKNVEEDIIKVDPNQLANNTKKEYRKSSSQLLESLRKGEYNQQYVSYFYELLKRADDIVNNSSPEQLRLLAEKYGMGNTNTNQFKFLHEDHLNKYGNKDMSTIKNEEIKKRVTTDDNFPIEKIITNKRQVLNMYEHASGAKAKYSYSIKVKRKHDVENRIEEISEYLHIKELVSEGNGRILEFFIPKKFQLENINQNSVLFSELKNIDYIIYTDDYGRKFEYSIKNFYKISENGMYDVFKFKGNKIENIMII